MTLVYIDLLQAQQITLSNTTTPIPIHYAAADHTEDLSSCQCWNNSSETSMGKDRDSWTNPGHFQPIRTQGFHREFAVKSLDRPHGNHLEHTHTQATRLLREYTTASVNYCPIGLPV